MTALQLFLLVGGAVVAFLLLQFVWLAAVLVSSDQKTNGTGYYGMSPEGRARFKATLRRQARLLQPILRLLGRFSRFTFEKATFRYEDIAGPRGTCSEESFRRGASYTARPEDVFVVTQMKCGTTWMQHVVYEVLQRGRGDLVASGRTLYAMAPWLEGRKSVAVEDAQPVGTERPSRIIKTHFPVQHCPFSPAARYIYVARHPVSCLASCADFIATNAGAMAPPLEAVEEWYRSDAMWWGTWPAHVRGWWDRSRTADNVLFVHFETMKRDLPEVVRQVAAFLGVAPLDDAELAAVVEKCGFAYMQRHADHFEMHPPHLLQVDAELFVRGTSDRHADVTPEVRRRVLEWCAAELEGSDYPFAGLYGREQAARAG